jgi:glycosyltransferase involved in cell wall biosynthesis
MEIKRNKTLVIIPVFNEASIIGQVLDKLLKGSNNCDILVINDGSSDSSEEEIAKRKVYTINHPYNMGIGTSFQTGCQFALSKNYEFIVRMDGDGQHDNVLIDSILDPVKKGEVDIVIGSRFLSRSEFKSSFFRVIGIKFISFLLTIMTKNKVTDPTSGLCAMNRKAFEFFSRECCEDYPEPEILVYHKDFRIKEIPIVISKRRTGTSSITPLTSFYYMFKVLFSLLIHSFRRRDK